MPASSALLHQFIFLSSCNELVDPDQTDGGFGGAAAQTQAGAVPFQQQARKIYSEAQWQCHGSIICFPQGRLCGCTQGLPHGIAYHAQGQSFSQLLLDLALRARRIKRYCRKTPHTSPFAKGYDRCQLFGQHLQDRGGDRHLLPLVLHCSDSHTGYCSCGLYDPFRHER